ncbi:MAG: Maf family nucleotide pyrophosphatase [Haliscomenobacter sp.]|uniref:Maf family nucleotide pyrophosphatase n=1 Tax=Haliscomenobacter sp. TaxID=2717303 RepID=UPI0029AFF130|nr:Maf family nucleotide pyrophosphatase [Haliscomenobacter sp.]MDX2068172.1 Maf family nucleotide pyrophosphatase [Haliscomenobacter sp.]
MNPLSLNIILASTSPRRSQLLREAGFNFTIKTTEVEETYPPDTPVDEVAAYLARKKAYASREFIQEDEIILAADSVVILDGIIYGKPIDAVDARQMLQKLSGQLHRVITGVCLLSKEREKVFSAESRVQFEPLSEAEIDFYVEKYRPFDKAGSYAIQEWIGLCKISRIEGTFTNIMGLPVDRVYRELLDF